MLINVECSIDLLPNFFGMFLNIGQKNDSSNHNSVHNAVQQAHRTVVLYEMQWSWYIYLYMHRNKIRKQILSFFRLRVLSSCIICNEINAYDAGDQTNEIILFVV